MWKLVFSNVSVEGWAIDLDIHGLLDGPGGATCLPAYDGEAAHTGRISCGLAMLLDGGGGFYMFFEPFPKGPSQLPDVLLLTICLGAFVPVDYPLF